MTKFRWRKNGGAWVVEDRALPYNLAGVIASDTVDVEAIGATVTDLGTGTPVPELNGFSQNGATNTRFIAALNRVKAGTGSGIIVEKGDSTTVGQGAGTGVNFCTGARVLRSSHIAAGLMRDLGVLCFDRAQMNTNRMEAAGTSLAAYDPRCVQGGWALLENQNFAGGGAMFRNSGPGAFTLTETDVDRFEIVCFNAASGNLDILIDGAAPAIGPATVLINGTGTGLTKIVVGAAAAGTHTLSLSSAQEIFFRSIRPFKSTALAMDYLDHAALGVTTESQASAENFGNRDSILYDAPDLTIIRGGLNDMANNISAATFKSAVQAIITDAKVSGDVLLMSPLPAASPYNNANIAAYRQALSELAVSNSVSYFDIWQYYGGFTTAYQARTRDGVHPTAELYAEIGSLQFDAIQNMVAGSGVF